MFSYIVLRITRSRLYLCIRIVFRIIRSRNHVMIRLLTWICGHPLIITILSFFARLLLWGGDVLFSIYSNMFVRANLLLH